MELVGLRIKEISYLIGGALIVGVLLFYILQGVEIHHHLYSFTVSVVLVYRITLWSSSSIQISLISI